MRRYIEGLGGFDAALKAALDGIQLGLIITIWVHVVIYGG